MSDPALMPLTPEMDALVQRIDLSDLYPPFAALLIETLAACVRRGVPYYAISGTRLWEEQQALYAKGRVRQADGTWTIVDASKVVTKARPGSSLHNYGLAADCCRDKDADRAGLQPGWAPSDYAVLAEEATRLGLDAGANWVTFRDYPHLQLNIRDRGLSVAHLRSLYERGGLSAVYEHLDGYDWRKRP